MATAVDLSGNCPMGAQHKDYPIANDVDLQAVKFRGAVQALTLGAASVQSNPFGQFCRAIRIAPEGNCHYRVGINPTAVKDGSEFLADGAVEIVPVRAGERIAVIQDVAETDKVIISEDK
jgi:hypothetical protein